MLAFPVIRLPGIYAALATLAFALMFEQIMVPQKWLSGGSLPVDVPRPQLGSINFTDDRYFLVLAGVLLGILLGARHPRASGTTGRFLDAVRGSEVGAASIGISPSRQRFIAFILAAGIAGFGGGLIASFDGQANYNNRFVFLLRVGVADPGGDGRIPVGAIGDHRRHRLPARAQAAGARVRVPRQLPHQPFRHRRVRKWLFGLPQASWAQGVAFILFGLGALTYAKHPEGIIEFQTTKSLQKILDGSTATRRAARHRDSPSFGDRREGR